MGENRNRIIHLENDVRDNERSIAELNEQLTAALENLNEDSGFRRDIQARVQTLQTIVDKHLASTAFLQGAGAQQYLSDVHHACRQVKDGMQAVHSWQNQMSKDFSKALTRVHALEESRLKLAALADDRIRDLERQLDEATENGRAAVSRMEQLETRLRKVEDSQVKVTFGPKTVHIPEKIHCGGPISVKFEPGVKTSRPGEIQCQNDGFEAGHW